MDVLECVTMKITEREVMNIRSRIGDNLQYKVLKGPLELYIQHATTVFT